MSKKIFIPVLIIFVIASCNKRPDIETWLTNNNRIYNVKKIDTDDSSYIGFDFFIKQPLDHFSEQTDSFLQHVTLKFRSYDSANVIITEGYSMGYNYISELSEMLGANEIRVEHRFFGKSKPDTLDWKYLNTKQASADYHDIISIFKQTFTDKWISTGWSKGGQTSLIFYKNYPEDINAVVAYDAPINFDIEDKRVEYFFDSIGTSECRSKILQFQRSILSKRKEITDLFKEYSETYGYKYSIGYDKALDFIVLEYPFSFWQYENLPCDSIPDPESDTKTLFEHLKRIVSFYSYSDYAMDSPSMYQFCTELGFYGYRLDSLQDLLSDKEYRYYVFAPKDADLSYSPELMINLNNWLKEKGNNIVYIYGSRDPWAAAGIETTGKTNSLKMILYGGNHFTFINSFDRSEREMIIDSLQNWIK